MKHKKRFSPLLILALFLILSGVAVLTYPIVGDYLANRQRSTATQNYNRLMKNIDQKDLNEQLKLSKQYNDNIYAQQEGKISPFPNLEYKKVDNLAGIMATLDVPSINIKKMPIYHGTNELTLSEGLGHFKQSSIPIGGINTRSVISGHSGLQNQVLFSNVKNLQVGDIFYINILGKHLAYKIESTEEVLPNEVDKVKIKPGKDMVTLLTCTPPGINTFRLLVNGVRIPYKEAQKEKVIQRDTFSYTKVVIASLTLCILLFIILYLIYRRMKKRYIKARTEDEVEKSKKRLIRYFYAIKILFVAMIIAMIAVLAFSLYGYVQIKQQQEMSIINVGQSEQLSDFNSAKIKTATYTESDVSSVNVGVYANAKTNFNQIVNNSGVGKLVIPKIDASLPILAGLNNDNLLNGAATLNQKETLGKGNYVLLSHNIPDSKGNASPVLLGAINELRSGDIMIASDFNMVYTYKVFLNRVVNEKEISYISPPDSSLATPVITLVRCEGGIGTTKRRIIQGSLVEKVPLEQKRETQLQELGLEHKGNVGSKIFKGRSYSLIQEIAMYIAAMMVNNPLQTIIPIFLVLIVPILFLNLF